VNAQEFRRLWYQIRPRIRREFRELTDQDLELIHGEKEIFTGILIRRHGMGKERIEQWLDAEVKSAGDSSRRPQ
jgi:hypothetical protein